MTLISLLTPTGGRKKSFALCEKWIREQTIHKDSRYKIEWLCVDDYAKDPTPFTCNQILLKNPKEWTPDYNTQRDNCTVLLEAAKGDLIFWIEDDDYYSPEYLETMIKLLEASEVAGLSYARYYHLGVPGYLVMTNYKHASLASTCFRKSLKKRMYRAINSGQFYFDIIFWDSCMKDGISSTLLAHKNISIGIKGGPGKAGLSNGHNKDNYTQDVNLSVAKGWLGENYKEYFK